jgi:hypothetical protein
MEVSTITNRSIFTKKSEHIVRKSRSPLAIRLVGLFFLSALVLYTYMLTANDQQTLRYEKISDPLLNPMMGWAPWATLENTEQPHTLVYADLTWRELELREGIFDFEFFERSRQFARWRTEGQRVVFRFVTDRPGDKTHLDIPDWLFEKMDQDGEFYDNEYGKGFSPNYSNPIFIEHHRLAIQALGNRYGKDDFFAFIELGSLGHWGEWHTHPGLRPFPSESVRDSFILQYVEAFPNTFLLMRRPFAIARQLKLGLYNDMTADIPATQKWLDWIANGGTYPPEDASGLLPMPDGWQQAPIGGEQSPTLTNETVFGTELEQTMRLLRASHTTFIGPGGPYDVALDGPLQAGLDQVLSTIGYRIYLDQVQMPRVIRYSKKLDIRFTFSNDGIAPIYYNWPSKVYIFDEDGRLIKKYPIDLELPLILPGMFSQVRVTIPINDLENGGYTIGLAILDPLTDQPSIKFANKNSRIDFIQEVGSFELKSILNSLYSILQ